MTDSNPFGVRRAEPGDFEPLVYLVLELVREDAVMPVSEAKVISLVERCVGMDNAIAGIIDGPDGDIEATIGLSVDQLDYSDVDYLGTKWLGTSASYRKRVIMPRHDTPGLGLATRLMRFAKWASDAMSLPLLCSVLTTGDLESKMLSFQRQAPQIGATFGWGDLPDRSFFNQTTLGGVRKPAGLSRSLARGQVRQPTSPTSTAVRSERDGTASTIVRATTG